MEAAWTSMTERQGKPPFIQDKIATLPEITFSPYAGTLNTSGWESMKLSKYAEYRFIYIDLDKTQIFGEEFSIIVSDNGLTTEYFYDYDLLFGGEGYPKQFKTKNDAGYDIFALMPSRYINGSKYRWLWYKYNNTKWW